MRYSIIKRDLAVVFHSLPLTAGGRTVFGHKYGDAGWYEFIRGVADPSHAPYDNYEFAVQLPVTEELPVQSSDPLTIIEREAAQSFYCVSKLHGGRTVYGRPIGMKGPWAAFIPGAATPNDKAFDNYEFAIKSFVDHSKPPITYPIKICYGYVIFDTVSDPSEPKYPRFDKPLRAAVLMNEICSIKEGTEYLLGDATVKLVVITTRRGEIFLIRNDGNHSIDSYVKLIASP